MSYNGEEFVKRAQEEIDLVTTQAGEEAVAKLNINGLHSEIIKSHKNSNYINFPKFAKQLSFIVKHTARDVEYLTDSFVEKNKDELSVFLQTALETSHKEVVDVFNETSGLGAPKPAEDVKKNPKEKYLGYKFRRNMDDLINTLARCYCHFVRCIRYGGSFTARMKRNQGFGYENRAGKSFFPQPPSTGTGR